jgi:hypothetical protein
MPVGSAGHFPVWVRTHTVTWECALGQAQRKNRFPASYVLPDEASAAFSLGFVLGQTTAYLEQVNAGAKLAAQIGCHATHSPAIRELAEKEGCRVIVEQRGAGRVAIWIFKHAFVETIIAEMSGEKTTPPNALEVWSMGKLFGYSDSEIRAYLQTHKLVRSPSDSESNQPPGLRRSG